MVRPFARVLRADERPGHCIRCPRNEDLIDLGAEGIPGYGIAYLCSVCLGELEGVRGLISADEHQQVVDLANEQLADLNAALAVAQQGRNAPAEYITEKMEEFADGIEPLVRRLLDGLAAWRPEPGARGVVAAAEVEPREPDVPVRDDAPAAGSAEPAHVQSSAAELAAALGLAGAVFESPERADAAGDADDLGSGDGGDELSLLYGEDPR